MHFGTTSPTRQAVLSNMAACQKDIPPPLSVRAVLDARHRVTDWDCVSFDSSDYPGVQLLGAVYHFIRFPISTMSRSKLVEVFFPTFRGCGEVLRTFLLDHRDWYTIKNIHYEMAKAKFLSRSTVLIVVNRMLSHTTPP